MRISMLARTVLLSGALVLVARPTLAQTTAQPKTEAGLCGNAKFNELDFWIGDWEVFDKKDKVADANVRKVLNNCALAETWTPPANAKREAQVSAQAPLHVTYQNGRGLSTYNPLTKKWEYFWVADRGYTSYWTGGLMGNEMRVGTDWPTPDGGSMLRRWSLFNLPDGRVRELCLDSKDGGKSWIPEYDLMWAKKK